MIKFHCITKFFVENSPLRRSQAKILGALVWSLLGQTLLATAAIDRQFSKIGTTTPLHTIKRVDRFLGKRYIEAEGTKEKPRKVAKRPPPVLTPSWLSPKKGNARALCSRSKGTNRLIRTNQNTLTLSRKLNTNNTKPLSSRNEHYAPHRPRVRKNNGHATGLLLEILK